MRQTLTLHPDFECPQVSLLEVVIARPEPGSLILSYQVIGNLADLHLPLLASPYRADELWRRTCFEVFVRPAPGEA